VFALGTLAVLRPDWVVAHLHTGVVTPDAPLVGVGEVTLELEVDLDFLGGVLDPHAENADCIGLVEVHAGPVVLNYGQVAVFVRVLGEPVVEAVPVGRPALVGLVVPPHPIHRAERLVHL